MEPFGKSWGIRGIAIVVLTVLVYLPAMRGGFIWDDDEHFTANPAMTSSGGLLQIWSSLRVSRYYPLTLTSFWIERHLWGLNPLPYHAVNVLLHGINAALLFVLLSRLRVPGAWCAAALWALHPVCVESAAWVTEMKNTQSGLFFFLALLLYMRADEDPADRRAEIWMVVCGVAAMLSKPSTVVLPAVILLMAWWRRGRWQREDWRKAAPLFVFGLAMSVLTIVEQHRLVERRAGEVSMNGIERALLTGKTVWFYLGKVCWPANLMFIYPRWTLDPLILWNWMPLLAVIVVGGVLWTARRRPFGRACVLGLGSFVLLLLPVSGLFDIYFFRFSFVGDHFQYLACLGPLALATAAACVVVRSPRMRAVATVIGLSGVAILTWRYSQVFQSDETLWRDTLKKNPNAWLAHSNLGAILLRQKKDVDAEAECEAALRIKPDCYEAHYNRGLALASQGRSSEAMAEYRETLRLAPDSPPVLVSLAWLLATAEDAKIRNGWEAVRLAERACEATHHRQADALVALAAAYAEAGRPADAIPIAQKVITWARAKGQPKTAARIETQLKLYQDGRPYHEDSPYPVLPE